MAWGVVDNSVLGLRSYVALAHSGVTSTADSMQPDRLLRTNRHALALIHCSALPLEGRFGRPVFFLTVIPFVTGRGACVDVRTVGEQSS